MKSDDLNKYLVAQSNFYETAIQEIKNSKKISHWMWYIFPQIQGLGNSEVSKKYSIKSIKQGRDYLEHKILYPRLIKATTYVYQIEDRTALEIFGHTDNLKFKSSMSLFSILSTNDTLFEKVLNKYYNGVLCKKTQLWFKNQKNYN
ncbi:MAG: calpastatin [Candidatus Marinimicrobia bacterium]|nr:calpastatin [Candidatus Neomarinimicrobiota bacterium]